MNRKPTSNPILTKRDWENQRRAALEDPGSFHGEIAKRQLYWFVDAKAAWCKLGDGGWQGFDAKTGAKQEGLSLSVDFAPWSKALDESASPFIRWFEGGRTNACFNEVDAAVLEGHGDETALIFEGEAWSEKAGRAEVTLSVSRRELLIEVARRAVALGSLGLGKGDRIIFNLPNTLEQIYLIEAAKRLGVVYTCVFGGLSAKALAERIVDLRAKAVFTAESYVKGGQKVEAKALYIDAALAGYVSAPLAKTAARTIFAYLEGADAGIRASFDSFCSEMLDPELVVDPETFSTAAVEFLRARGAASDALVETLTKSLVTILRSKAALQVNAVVVTGEPSGSSKTARPRDVWLESLLAKADVALGASLRSLKDTELVSRVYAVVPPVAVEADYPLFVAYTSGSTGKPKGIVHTHGGYLAGVAHTMKVSFGAEPGKDVLYAIADPGWITGQSYMITGALVARVTSVVTEGGPLFPHATRFAQTIERFKVTILKAGSTFLRNVAANPAVVEELKAVDLTSLKTATFCAEPVNPAIQQFGMENITSRYINSYWATEHGGMVLTHFFGNSDFPLAADARSYAMPWIFADVWLPEGESEEGERASGHRVAGDGEKGELVITRPYPSLARTIWGDAANFGRPGWKGDIKRFAETYFGRWSPVESDGRVATFAYTQGDFASRYEDGSFSLHGRSDEVIKTSGHRIGTEEIESAILKDKLINPASPVRNVVVIGAPDEERGSVPLAFIQVTEGTVLSLDDQLRISSLVMKEKGEIAVPAGYLAVPQFPETRSGKYMRRLMKALLTGGAEGDVTTLRNPESLPYLRTEITKWQDARARLQEQAKKDAASSGDLLELLGHQPKEKKRAALTQFLMRELSKIVLADAQPEAASRLSASAPLRDLGLDSLKAMRYLSRIRSSLGSELGRKISVTMMFNHPTVNGISEYMASEILRFDGARGKQGPRRSRRAGDEPMAIVGMSCRFPGGITSTESMWKFLVEGKDAIGEIPADRWNVERYFDPERDAEGKMYVKKGGFLDSVDRFDAGFFSINPREAKALDPQHRLLMELSWEALEHAAIDPNQLKGSRTGVYVGITTREYAELLARSKERADLEPYIPTGNNLNTASGRISYFLDLRGPAVSVDTACSSSLVALHLACQSLRTGETDLAIACGVNLMLTPDFSVSLCKTGALSPDGKCRTFDAGADGYVRAEGSAVVIVKRLSQAVEDGDVIHALLVGTGINQDGRSSGLTAPSGPAQESLIQDVLERAGLEPSAVTYVEAHGTGTPLGDPIEFQALAGSYGRGRTGDNPLYVGSIKTNIGHTESAAGLAGLMKAVLCLKNKAIPAHQNFTAANPHIDLASIPAKIPLALEPWQPKSGERIAGVSSFGFSGTNSHVILKEASVRERPEKPGTIERPEHVLAISAKSEQALKDLVASYRTYLSANPDVPLSDICFTAAQGRAHFDHRMAVVANSRRELSEFLALASSGQHHESLKRGTPPGEGAEAQTLFLFSGQGAQYAGMAKELYETQPVFRRHLDECAEKLNGLLPEPLLEVIFHKEELLNLTRYTQPSLFALEYSLFQLWKSWGIEPAFVMGHSVGEFAAACCAGLFSLEDGLRLIAKRAELMQKLPGEGAMAVAMTVEQDVLTVIRELGVDVAIAAVNGPAATTFAGYEPQMSKVIEALLERGIKTKRLVVTHAFHSSQMDPMLDEFEAFVRTIEFAEPTIPIISNLTGKAASFEEMSKPGYWRRHVREAVRFSDGVEFAYQSGCRVFLELGPGGTLASMGAQCVPEEGVLWMSTLRKGRADSKQLMIAVASLYTWGKAVDWRAFEAETPSRLKVELPTYPFQRERFWVEPAQAPLAVAPRPEAVEAAKPVPVVGETAPAATVVPLAPRESGFVDKLFAMSAGERVEAIRKHIEGEVRQLLTLRPEQVVDPEKGLVQLGVDSLMAIELRNRLKKALGPTLGKNLPTTLIFKHPTIAKLAAFIDKTIGSDPSAAAPPERKAGQG